jgi:signal transduction histidine kinase
VTESSLPNKLEVQVASVLHTHAHRLLRVKQALEPVLETLGVSLEESSAERERLDLSAARQAASAVHLIVQSVGESWSQRGIVDETRTALMRADEQLPVLIERISAGHGSQSALVQETRSLLSALERDASLKYNKQELKALKAACRRVTVSLSVSGLHFAMETISALEGETRALLTFYEATPQSKAEFTIENWETLVTLALREVARMAEARGIEIRRVRPRGTAKVACSKTALLRAMVNILNNAIKYNYSAPPPVVWVDIRVKDTNDEVTLEVQNWGLPIEREEIEAGSIFHIGFRGMHARAHTIGSGIGLADVKRTVAEHGGRIDVESRLDPESSASKDRPAAFITTVRLTLKKYKAG